MTIQTRGNQFCALSEDGTRSFGCFDTREKAVARLAEVEGFKSRALALPTISSEMIECGDVYEKDIIYTGSFIHPSTGQKFTVDHAKIDLWVAAHGKMMANGIKVPFGEGHRHASNQVYGYVTGMRRDGDRMIGKFSIEDDEAKTKVGKGIQEVSAFIHPEFMDGKGVKYGEVIRHVAATPYPVIPNQTNFVKLDEGEEIEIFQLSFNMEDDPMEKLLEKLGVKDEKEAVEKVGSLSTEIEDLKAKLKLSEEEEKPEGGGDDPKPKEGDEGEGNETPEFKALSAKFEKLEGIRRKEFLDLAVEQGKIKAEQHEHYLELMVSSDDSVRKIINDMEGTSSEGIELDVKKTGEEKEEADAKAELEAIKLACEDD